MQKLFFLALLSMIPGFAPAHAAEWIVDAAGGGQFTDLPAAVAAAAPGDRLLVRPGTYSGARIRRGLEIHGLGSLGGVALRTPIFVEDLPAGERVYLGGLYTFSFFQSVSSSPKVAQLSRCQGTVQIERCSSSFSLSQWSPLVPPIDAAFAVHACRLVTVRGCTFHGYRNSGGQTSIPVSLSNSTVRFYDCEIMGAGGDVCAGQRGALAISASSCELLFSGCTVYGGTGSPFYCLYGGSCTAGVGSDAVLAPLCHVSTYGSDVQGGYNGPIVCFPPPPPTRTTVAWAGPLLSLNVYPEPLPSIELAAPLRMGTTVQVQLELASAHPQVLFVALRRAELELPGLVGSLWLDPSTAFLVGVTSGTTGATTIAFPVENEPLAFGYELHFQAIDVRGRCGAPTSAVLQ